jgi:hypothetical protein
LPGALLSGFYLDTTSGTCIALLTVFIADFLITKKKNRILLTGGLFTALAAWTTVGHIRHTQIREVLLTETNAGLTLVYTADGHSQLWTRAPAEPVQPMHPLEPYLSFLGTELKYGQLVLPEEAIWTKITPPQSTDTLLVVLPAINDVRVELSEWQRVSHLPVVFGGKVRRGVRDFLTSNAANSACVRGSLREGSWIYKNGQWQAASAVYPP